MITLRDLQDLLASERTFQQTEGVRARIYLLEDLIHRINHGEVIADQSKVCKEITSTIGYVEQQHKQSNDHKPFLEYYQGRCDALQDVLNDLYKRERKLGGPYVSGIT